MAVTFKPADLLWTSSLEERGYGCFVDLDTGQRVLITHATEQGRLLCLRGEDAARLPRPDVVVCCHPGRAAKRYPSLQMVGDWDGMTKPVLQDGLLMCYSEEEVQMWKR